MGRMPEGQLWGVSCLAGSLQSVIPFSGEWALGHRAGLTGRGADYVSVWPVEMHTYRCIVYGEDSFIQLTV